MAQPLDPVPISPDQPGVSKRFSPLAIGNRWIDMDKTIFVDGRPEKMRGWLKKTLVSVNAPIRGLLYWSTKALLNFYAMGTYAKLYVVDDGQTPIDITPGDPNDPTGTLTNPFTTTAGSKIVQVHDVGHGRNAGDTVYFSGGTAVGGITISGPYVVQTRIDDDNYTILSSTAATSAATGGGTVTYSYELPVGPIDPLQGDGYGAGPYGSFNYGAPTEATGTTVIFEPRIWSLAQNGDLLYANPLNGTIYVFDPAALPSYQRATKLANSPAVVRSIFVTPERFLFALGTNNDTMNIMWPDRDDHTAWTVTVTNTANSRRLDKGTRIIGGAGLGNQVSGVWTDTALFRFQYTGNQFIYDSRLVGTACGLVSPLALLVRVGVAYWMSRFGFHYWGGGGAPEMIPNSEDVREFVIRALRQLGWEFKCNTHYSPRFNLLMWFYVPLNDDEPSLYAGVNLTDYSWIVGHMERTSGTTSPDQRPVTAGSDGWLYQHEEGLDADGEIMQAYLRRAPLQVANGTMLGEVNGIITDMQRQTGTMSFDLKMFERIRGEMIDSETIQFEPGEDLIDPTVGGRIADITIRCESLGGDFRLGAPLLMVKSTGRIR